MLASHLKWLGRRTHRDASFSPAGLGTGGGPMGADDQGLISVGSLLIEAEIKPSETPVNLLRYSCLDPWPSGLTICLEASGTFRLLQRQGPRHLATALHTGLGDAPATIIITYVWDAPARRGHFAVFVPETGELWHTDVLMPFPLTLRDASRILTDDAVTRVDQGFVFAALCEGLCPIGPMPGLRGDAILETTDGPLRVDSILPGDYVLDENGDALCVRWVGETTLPNAGRFAPIQLLQPYMGLWAHLVMAPDQRVSVSGSEIEYLFGQERVSTPVGQLMDRNSTIPNADAGPVLRYHQVLLDRHAIINANGAWIESFDADALLTSPSAIRKSVLSEMPSELLPQPSDLVAPVLRSYETLMLKDVALG